MLSHRPKKRIVVIGGGYAGLTATLELAGAGFDVLLIDRKPHFLALTQLHKTVHTELDRLQIPYQDLAARHGFAFRCAPVDFDEAALAAWQDKGAASVGGDDVPFDYLVVCTGARAYPLEEASPADLAGRQLLGLETLKTESLMPRLQDFLDAVEPKERAISVVGGGPSGIQFLFELDDFLRLHRQRCRLRFLHLEERMLPGFPARFHQHIQGKVEARRGTMEYLPQMRFLAQGENQVELEQPDGERLTRSSQLTLLFPGLRPQPVPLRANRFGQLYADGRLLPKIFGAGDCVEFEGPGLNTLSAQAAVRKGKIVAENLQRHAGGWSLRGYDYQELGYFISLGTWDGIGWMLSKNNVLAGLPAFAIKETVEAQFNWLLDGYDTYLV